MEPQPARQERWEPPTEGSPEEIAWGKARARRAAWMILIPFALALAVGVGLRVALSLRATKDITALARIVAEKSEGGAPISTVVEGIVTDTYGNAADIHTRDEYRELVHTVAYQLQSLPPAQKSAPDSLRDFVEEEFRNNTWSSLRAHALLVGGVQAGIVLFFPALFIAAFFQAARGIAAASSEASRSFESFTSAVRHRRRRRFLAEQAGSFFWRRLGFAVLIALGSTFFFAPEGLRASIVGEYIALHSIPSGVTYPFFLTHFGGAPPFVIGFAGFLLYALGSFVHRFAARDLSHRMFVSLFNRGVTVLILSLVLSGVTEGESISRALIFAGGVFPQTGLQAIAKMTQTRVDQLTGDAGAGFRGLPEIDVWKQTSLRELGILDVHDLARADLSHLVESVGINPHLLLRAADRALLLHVFGSERATSLSGVPLYTASEVVLYVRGADAYAERWRGKSPRYQIVGELVEEEAEAREALVEKTLGTEDVSLQIAQLEVDQNVMFLIDNKLMYGNL